MFKLLGGGTDQLWQAIIRPPRDIYDKKQLGQKEFMVKHFLVQRTDLKLTNSRNQILECSFFSPKYAKQKLPCVIYLHGNSSSRLEALSSIQTLLSQNIQLFCFDFSGILIMQGCGLSEGTYISLGHFECDDLSCVIEYLRSCGKVSTIGLWGRSMGAITALMYADRDPSIAGMVLDSAMTDLKTLANQLCKQYITLPKFLFSKALQYVRSCVLQKAAFDINFLCPIDHCKKSFIPALFVAAKDDTFIIPSHSQQLYEAYQGDKNIILVEGDHNSPRPEYLQDSIGIFFYNTLLCDQLEILEPPNMDFQPQINYIPQKIQNKSIDNEEEKNITQSLSEEEQDIMNQVIIMSLKEQLNKEHKNQQIDKQSEDNFLI